MLSSFSKFSHIHHIIFIILSSYYLIILLSYYIILSLFHYLIILLSHFNISSFSYDLIISSARVFDTTTFKCTATFVGHEREISKGTFNPSGKRVATASSDKTVRIWDVNSGKCLQVRVTINPSGKWVATASSDKTVRIWDVNSGKSLQVKVTINLEIVNS